MRHAVSRAWGAACAGAIAASVSGAPPVELIATARIPANARDLSGLPGTIAGTIPNDRLGGLGSAIAWTGSGWTFVMLPDRGPIDGGAAYQTRVQVIEFAPDFSERSLDWKVIRTVMLTDEDGRPLPGNSGAYDPSDRTKSRRFDPEGLRIGRDGVMYISDEYGPAVDVFSPSGKRAARLSVPGKYGVSHEDGLPEGEMPPSNTKGRQPNRGFEGLALTPDGKTAVAMLQSPLIQDGGLDKKNKRDGVNIRVLFLDTAGGAPREMVYALESDRYGVSEIAAIDASRMLVLERDGEAGSKAETKAIYLADFSRATDVSDIDALPKGDLPDGIAPAGKGLLFDLVDPVLRLNGEDFPEKVEGLALGPALADGRLSLLVSTDNDFKDGQPTFVWLFAVDAALLRGAGVGR